MLRNLRNKYSGDNFEVVFLGCPHGGAWTYLLDVYAHHDIVVAIMYPLPKLLTIESPSSVTLYQLFVEQEGIIISSSWKKYHFISFFVQHRSFR